MTYTCRAPLALLIDDDNASPRIDSGLFKEVAQLGSPVLKRTYGDWTKPNLKGWKKSVRDFAIQPIQQFAHTPRKNATDGPMDLLYTRPFSGFCIVSSDSDSARLAARIREQAVTVYGFGERRPPRPFITTCDEFVYFDVLNASAKRSMRRRSPLRKSQLRPSLKSSKRRPGRRVWIRRSGPC
ncbi:NYN domain-containing protein [Rhizobium herbae]|jgi:hypothetical protein